MQTDPQQIRSALYRAQLECARYLAAGVLPDELVAEVAEISVLLFVVEPGAVS